MGLTLDVRGYIKDVDTYDAKTKARFQRTLNTYAKLMDRHQTTTLIHRVIKWTGRLANSISVDKGGRFTRIIGPDEDRVKYARWIEDGGRGGFTGYKYVRNSIWKVRRGFMKQLKRDIERE